MGRILESSSHWAKNECVCFCITCRAKAQKWTICSNVDAYIAEERWALTTQMSTELLSFLGISLIDGSYSHKRTPRITWPGHLGIWKKKSWGSLKKRLSRQGREIEGRECVPSLMWGSCYGQIRTETWLGYRKLLFRWEINILTWAP